MYNQHDIKQVSEFIRPVAKAGLIYDPDAIIETLEKGLQSDPAPDTYMTKQEILKLFNMHEQTFYSWIRRGWLTPYGKGRKQCFLRSEVLAVNSRKASRSE